MEDVLDTPFYQDDILSRTLTTSVLYDKSALELNFQPTCNSNNNKAEHDEPTILVHQNQNNSDSPNLDFLKLGSPDLEKMFMNFQGSDTSSPGQDQNSSFQLNSSDSVCSTENSFTNALQQLHDQQDVPDQASMLEHFNGGQDTLTLVENKHQTTQNQHPHNETTEHHDQRRNHVNRRHDITDNVFATESNANPTVCSNMHVSCDGTILACAPQNIPQRVVPSNLPLGMQGQTAQEAAVFHNFNIMNNNGNAMQSQIMRQVEHQAFYGHNMGNFHDRDNIHNVYEFSMHDGSNPNGQMRGMPPKFHDGGYVEPAFTDQIPLPGIENLPGMGMDDQSKVYVENSHMQPINLEIQELVKRERKKLRNRIASSKCRKRKLEREARLEDRVKDLKEKNIELNAVSNALKQQVCDLKQRVMDHVSEGCQIVLPPS